METVADFVRTQPLLLGRDVGVPMLAALARGDRGADALGHTRGYFPAGPCSPGPHYSLRPGSRAHQ